MQADNSRRTFDATKHYNQVLMQQGRVQVDADWNEQQEINQHRIETEASDIIGPCGAPKANAGFKLKVQTSTTPPTTTLLIGKGRYYVDGILCENEQDVTYEKQPYLKYASNNPPPDVLTLLNNSKTLWAIVYLDVWKRHITALDDASIRETALNGPDTSTRVQTTWQIGIVPLALPADVQQQLSRLSSLRAELAKLESARTRNARQIAAVKKEIESISQAIATFSSQVTCISKSPEWDKLIAPSTGTLNARTRPVQSTKDPCLIPPSAGYKRLENQLYRVEVHLPSDAEGGPTFKWSRENASIITPITAINGNDITVHDLGRDEILGFATGQWVELVSDDTELRGLPGQLLQISNLDVAKLTVSVTPTPTEIFDATLHPKLRRWEQVGATATANGVHIDPTLDWLPLEDGIEVQFSQDTYKTGDYWLIPARTVTADIEWPRQNGTNSPTLPQSRLGIQHHFCRLGLLRVNEQNQQLHVQDCREIFPTLIPPAMHVLGTNWHNDDLFSPTQFIEAGLRITLDAVPEQVSVSTSDVIVTAEVPPSILTGTAGGVANEFLISLILNGSVQVEQNVIHWLFQQRPATANTPVEAISGERFNALALSRAAVVAPPRIRVAIKGHTIWSDQEDQRYYLDGQVFGHPDLRSDQKTPCIGLNFPSGMAEQASDFESWFFLGEPPKIAEPLRVTRVRFIALEPNNQEITVEALDWTNIAPTSTTPPPELQQGVSMITATDPSIIEITFSRAVVLPGGFVSAGKPQSIAVNFLAGAAHQARVNADITIVNNTTMRFIAREPAGFAGNLSPYQLIVFGDAQQGNVVVNAQDDGTALDGDFDGKAGGNLVLPFKVSEIIIT